MFSQPRSKGSTTVGPSYSPFMTGHPSPLSTMGSKRGYEYPRSWELEEEGMPPMKDKGLACFCGPEFRLPHWQQGVSEPSTHTKYHLLQERP